MEFGPDNALYTFEYATGYFAEVPAAQLARHPQTSTAGCEGTISVPIDEAHVGAANISAVFVATYTDDPGGGEPPQQGSAEVRLVPAP